MGNVRYASYNPNYSVIRPGDNNAYFNGTNYPVISMSVLPRSADTMLFTDGVVQCDFVAPSPFRASRRATAMA